MIFRFFSILLRECIFDMIWHGFWIHVGVILGIVSHHLLVSFFDRIWMPIFQISVENGAPKARSSYPGLPPFGVKNRYSSAGRFLEGFLGRICSMLAPFWLSISSMFCWFAVPAASKNSPHRPGFAALLRGAAVCAPRLQLHPFSPPFSMPFHETPKHRIL